MTGDKQYFSESIGGRLSCRNRTRRTRILPQFCRIPSGALFLLNKDGVTIIRRPLVEQKHQAELMAQQEG